MTTVGGTRGTVEVDFRSEVFQHYIHGLRMAWQGPLYRKVLAEAEPFADRAPSDIEIALRSSDTYRLYGWLEHNLQTIKYLSRYGLLPALEARQDELVRLLDQSAKVHPERLLLDPGLELPDYYLDSDFHQHPGGIWSDDTDAFAYEWAVSAFNYSMVAGDQPYQWLADLIVERYRPASIVDLGCAFGKLLRPLKRLSPHVNAIGLDLSAPMLRLAHHRALESGLEIYWRQAAAERTGLPAASTDVVAMSFLLHEMPVNHVRQVLREARRILRPGGAFANVDVHGVAGGNLGSFFHFGHSARNNEPFMPGLALLDMGRELEAAGFVDVELSSALTSGAPITDASPLPRETWRHAWTLVTARVPGAAQ